MLKSIVTFVGVIICVVLIEFTSMAASKGITFSQEEKDFIYRTQNGEPLKIGIIPHSFPLSACPPETTDFTGINVEMLSAITEASGLNFSYYRVPIETKTPYQVLEEGSAALVAGSIKLDHFIENPSLILSDRFCDGSAICIAKKSTNPMAPITGKIAILHGYQAGIEFAKEQFPLHEVVLYPDNQEVLRAVRTGQADLTMISRYVGIFELQNPLNDQLVELPPYQIEKDSCIMGLNTEENQAAISIINKALESIGEDGYNYAQMNFSLSHPYKLTAVEFIYKYRYLMVVVFGAFIGVSLLTLRLLYANREHKLLSIDALTGAYSEAGFELAAAKIMPKASHQLFVTDFDIVHFSGYNELNGKEQGDELLKDIVRVVTSFLSVQDVICRSYADHFKVLSCKENLESLLADINKALEIFKEKAQSPIILNFGIYQVTNREVPISKMLDFAAIAKKNVKENPDKFISVFDELLLERHINEVRMIAAFSKAIENEEFIPYYQPKFDAVTKKVIGAEALVRWISEDGTIVPPIQFIELFEKSGQIQQLDFFMLERVCMFLKELMMKEITPLPIAVNFSRVHLYSGEFIDKVNQIVSQYGIPKCLIEIECTETTMMNDIELTKGILGKLQREGFSIAMDDFGSAYSSLNTLCSIPLDVIKLDRGFLMVTLSNEKEKARIIIRSVMSLAHELSLRIVAEGVETEEQYLFLKSLGCDFIQGYYFSKPLAKKDFIDLMDL